VSRAADPALLRELSARWQGHGCAICGRSAPPDAELGYRVELHHLVGRAQLGPDTERNIIGLGGAFLCNHHPLVTEHKIELYRTDAGELVWTDHNGGRGVCRRLPESYYTPTMRMPVTTVLDPETGELEPVAGPQERFTHLRTLIRESERRRLAAAIGLLVVFENREYERLEMTWQDYYTGLGLAKATASKMLTVARTFRGAWQQLPEADQAELSVGRLYVAAQLVAEGLDADEALHKAVQTPTHHLIAERKGEEPVERRPMTCPECGEVTWHRCSTSTEPQP
jgi:hypothetical protein